MEEDVRKLAQAWKILHGRIAVLRVGAHGQLKEGRRRRDQRGMAEVDRIAEEVEEPDPALGDAFAGHVRVDQLAGGTRNCRERSRERRMTEKRAVSEKEEGALTFREVASVHVAKNAVGESQIDAMPLIHQDAMMPPIPAHVVKGAPQGRTREAVMAGDQPDLEDDGENPRCQLLA